MQKSHTPYPARLLPESSFELIDEPDPNHILCRWADPSIPLKENDGKLNPQLIDEKRIPGFSLNKIPESEISDINIEFNDYENFLVRWKKGDNPAVVSETDFYYSKGNYFLFKIDSIHKYDSTYPYPIKKDGIEQQIQFNFKVLVKHAPLIVNYFHFELMVFDKDNVEIAKRDAKWKKVITADIRQKIITISKFALEEFNE